MDAVAKGSAMTKSRGINRPKFAWTPECERQVRELYPNTPNAQIVEVLGCSLPQLYSKAKRLGVQKSAEFLAGPHAGRIQHGQMLSPGTTFKKGQTSWIKGKKVHFPGSVPTQFRPGQRPRNEVPIGTERVKVGYLWRKVSEKRTGDWRADWRQVHLLVWEQHHGPIPPGHAVMFRPGRKTLDASLITADALELVPKTELMRRNTIHRYAPELREVIRLSARVRRTLDKRAENEKQD